MDTERKIIADCCRKVIAEIDLRIPKCTDNLDVLRLTLERAEMHQKLINQTDISRGELNRWHKDLEFVWNKLQKDVYATIKESLEARKAELNYNMASTVILGEIYHEVDVKVVELNKILSSYKKYYNELLKYIALNPNEDSLQLARYDLESQELKININAKEASKFKHNFKHTLD